MVNWNWSVQEIFNTCKQNKIWNKTPVIRSTDLSSSSMPKDHVTITVQNNNKKFMHICPFQFWTMIFMGPSAAYPLHPPSRGACLSITEWKRWNVTVAVLVRNMWIEQMMKSLAYRYKSLLLKFIELCNWSILVMWLECWFLDTEVDGSNPGISMLCPWARHFIRIASVDSAVKWVPGGNNLLKGAQCYELFGGIALKDHTFFIYNIFLTRFPLTNLR